MYLLYEAYLEIYSARRWKALQISGAASEHMDKCRWSNHPKPTKAEHCAELMLSPRVMCTALDYSSIYPT